MTIVATRPTRTVAPRAFRFPVVREIASGDPAGAVFRT